MMEDREYELKHADLALKEREVAAREREVAAKEKEGKTSTLFSPLTIAIYVAAFGLLGNIITNILNNRASDKAERLRAQSNLVLSVIKTNGNEIEACENLNFFVNTGWLDDANGAIHKVCGTNSGVPTLPNPASPVAGIGVDIIVKDADSHKPLYNAIVRISRYDLDGSWHSDVQFTDTGGTAESVYFVSLRDTIEVSKDGYETKRIEVIQFLFRYHSPVTIELHRVPKAKP